MTSNTSCNCDGCWDCAGHVEGCTCDVDWDEMAELSAARAGAFIDDDPFEHEKAAREFEERRNGIAP